MMKRKSIFPLQPAGVDGPRSLSVPTSKVEAPVLPADVEVVEVVDVVEVVGSAVVLASAVPEAAALVDPGSPVGASPPVLEVGGVVVKTAVDSPACGWQASRGPRRRPPGRGATRSRLAP